MEPADILRTSIRTIEARGALRDTGQERSMARTVASFNALTGHQLTEVHGWTFMVLLKLAREQSGHDADNWVDAAGYVGLAGECATSGLSPSNERAGPAQVV
jgi:Domain of unknown function (DUF6378)